MIEGTDAEALWTDAMPRQPVTKPSDIGLSPAGNFEPGRLPGVMVGDLLVGSP